MQLITPKMMTILSRRLKDGYSFVDFHKEWMPITADAAHYFSFPVQVIHLQNVYDASEIVSIGILGADEAILHAEANRLSQSEQLRSERIATVCDKLSDTKLFRVIAVDDLGG